MKALFALTLAVAFVPLSRAEDRTIENPAYASWAKHKVGTTVTQKTVTEAAGNKIEATMIYKLLEVKPDKIVLEYVTKSKIMGMEFEQPAQKMDIEKTVKVDPKAAEAAEKEKAKYTTTNGEETLKIGGKEIKTKWTKVKGNAAGVEYEAQTWTSDDMPMLTVKMVSKASGATTTLEVTELKTP